MYALAIVGDQPLLITLLLYAVTSIEPTVADVSGGTLLTIAGEGLADQDDLTCKFADGLSAPATWVSASQLQCYTPKTNMSSESCTGEVCGRRAGMGLWGREGMGVWDYGGIGAWGCACVGAWGDGGMGGWGRGALEGGGGLPLTS